MKAFIALTLVFCILRTHAQDALDSLKKTLDTTRAEKQVLLGYLKQIQSGDPSEIDRIRLIGDWIIQHSHTPELQEIQAGAHFALGRIYTNASMFAEASRYLTIAQHIAEEQHYDTIYAQVLNALGSIYRRNEQTEKAADFFKQSLSVSKRIHYEHGMARALYNLGSLQFEQGSGDNTQLLHAAGMMRQACYMTLSISDTQSIITQSNGLAGVYISLKKFDSALFLLKRLEKILQHSTKQLLLVNHYAQVGRLHNARKDYPAALKNYKEGLVLAEKYQTPRLLCMYYAGLAETYENAGDFKNANYYNRLNIQMHDELVKKENFAAAADIQNKYERAKKDNEILKLAAVNKQKSFINALLIGSSVCLLLISFLGYRIFKHRNKIVMQEAEIHHQKVVELEKEKQFLAAEAMLKGQEEERSRIAKDLHDGLGGLLSGTKLSLLHVKDNLHMTKENSMLFDRSLSMLDNTIGDLRKVAHNLMPEALVKYGLTEAVRDFCDSIRFSTGVNVLFQHFGEKRRLSTTAEMYIYRIVQELVNNALKHAEADQVLVQITRSPFKTQVTVEDNGKGFDPSVVSDVNGSGMENIQYRVQYFNGKIDIISSPGNGTSVNIELTA